jgi:hypothetical protein
MVMVRAFVLSIMDEELCRAFGYARPPRWVVALCRSVVRVRGRLVRRFPPRRRPFYAHQLSYVRTYPGGYRVEDLGTFPGGREGGRRASERARP